MVGENKVKFINDELKIFSFDYLGNSNQDLPIWKHTKRIIYTNVSNSNMTASNFCRELLVNTGVLMFPGILFGDEDDKYIRLSYLQPIEKIEESMTRINNFLK